MISVVFFVLICSKETKTDMNTQKRCTRQSVQLYSYLLYHNYNSPFYFFNTTASFVCNGYSGFQDTWMTEWGQKSKSPKFPGLKINSQKKSYTELRATNIFQLKSSQIKKILAKFFLPQKNPGIENFKPKKSFDHRRHLKSGVTPLEFRSTPNFLIESFAYDVFHNSKSNCRIRS